LVDREPTNEQFFHKDHQDDQVKRTTSHQTPGTKSPEQARRATGAQESCPATSPEQEWPEQLVAKITVLNLTDVVVIKFVLRGVAGAYARQ